jgi:mxaL protein
MNALHLTLLSKGAYLWFALFGLVIAIYNPKMTLSRDFYNYMFVIDITQSMNVSDMQINGQSVSRLNYVTQLISTNLKEFPCGSKVSIALFAHAEVVPLYIPIEVCDNFGVIQDTLSHIEWRMAWRGSSHLRLGLIEASNVLLTIPEPAQIVFFHRWR